MPLNDVDEFTTSDLREPLLFPTEIGMGLDEEVTLGNVEIGNTEIGNVEIGNAEIGNVEIGAVRKVLEKARDNRRPAPRMRAVDIDTPRRSQSDNWAVANVCIGVAESTGNPNPFPLTSELLSRFGAGGEPRYVRIDTEDSYQKFRAEQSPELAELRTRVEDLARRLSTHEADPNAHADTLDEIEELTLLGEAVQSGEQDKRVDLYLPKHFDGQWAAWREGDLVCASLMLSGKAGEVRICTSVEPLRRCIDEMARHASEANVPASAVLKVLPAMGCTLGAATIIKEMNAAIPSLLQRKEMDGSKPFVVRIEPRANPSLCALAALAQECSFGNQKACDEWERLRAASPAPVQQLMDEALQLLKKAA